MTRIAVPPMRSFLRGFLRAAVVLASILLVSGCGWVGASRQAKTDHAEKKAPESVRHAKRNHEMGPEAYRARLTAAPKRKPEQRIQVKVVLDLHLVAEEFARHMGVQDQKYMYDKICPEWGTTLGMLLHGCTKGSKAERPQSVIPQAEYVRGLTKDASDWFDHLIDVQHKGEVYVYLHYTPVVGGELGVGQRGFRISAQWSSTYLREDYSDETLIRVKGDQDKLDELLTRIYKHIDTDVRLELPDLEIAITFTPGHEWVWFELNVANSGSSSWDFDD